MVWVSDWMCVLLLQKQEDGEVLHDVKSGHPTGDSHRSGGPFRLRQEHHSPKLIAGFWDVTGGSVAWAVDLRKIPLEQLNRARLPMYLRTTTSLTARCGTTSAWAA